MYSAMYVFLGGSQANALTFGQSVLQASTPQGTAVDHRLQKFFAILLVGVICQLQSLSRLNYIRFSNVFAVYKLAFLSLVTILGWCALRQQRAPAAARTNDPYGIINLTNSFAGTTKQPYAIALAMLDIMRVYSGYENTNYVRIPVTKWRELLTIVIRFLKKCADPLMTKRESSAALLNSLSG
jgi:Amino acid permease